MPSPNDSPRTTEFYPRLVAAWARLDECLPLVAIPFLGTFLAIDDVRRAVTTSGFHLGFAFRFPAAMPTLWTFVSLPSRGPGVHVSSTVYLIPAVLLVKSALTAGLIGSLEQVLETGSYRFATNVRRYFGRFLVYEVLVWALFAPVLLLGVAGSILVLFTLPLFVAVSYLFYATPYLLVTEDLGVVEALSLSYRLAVAGGAYFEYGIGHLLFVLVVSLVGTVIATNLGIGGVVLGAALSAPLCVALAAATLDFVAELDGTGPAATVGDRSI